MPQFDISTYSSQIFWLLISGILLYSFVKWVFVPRLEDIFKNRMAHLEAETKTIQALESRLEAITKKRAEEIQNAEQQTYNQIKDIQIQLNQNREAELEALDKELKEKIATFEAELQQQIDQVYQSYGKNKEDYLQTVAQKLIKGSV